MTNGHKKNNMDSREILRRNLSEKHKQRILFLCETLRSGFFTQGVGANRQANNKCCCLGVACEVAIHLGLPLNLNWTYPVHCQVQKVIYSTPNDKTDTRMGALPKSVMNFYGFFNNDPAVQLKNGNTVSLIHCNDTLKMTFCEIADTIKYTYLDPTE